MLDECSMVDEELGRDLMSFGTPILVLGDPGQLPPISGGGFFTDHEPDFLLTEIHRQGRENPLIRPARGGTVLSGPRTRGAALNGPPAGVETFLGGVSASRRQAGLPEERSGQG